MREAIAAISSEIVSLHKQFYGKGPVKAKAFLVNDTVLCILEGGFTIVERTLIDEGREQTVHDMRRSFQLAMENRFKAVIEDALGRKVRAYVSQVHTDPDVAVELFMLEPAGQPARVEYELEIPAEG